MGNCNCVIECYYEKMGLDSLFCERMCFCIDDLLGLIECDVERLLWFGVIFGKIGVKIMIVVIKSLMWDVEGEVWDVRVEILSELCLVSKVFV